jgi:hypothetical protein
MQPRNDTVVGAHFGRAGQGPKMDPRRLNRLVERTAVGEGQVTAHPARAKRRVRVARVFISPEAAGAPIYL